MNLADLIQRGRPDPWAEGDNIPWHEPEFSRRMLKEHLTQDHDAASRRSETIDRHVAFIHQHGLGGQPGRVLDLGCGPGLYACRLARLGHTVEGVDFSPASIAYARQTAAEAGLTCQFTLSDLRTVDLPAGVYDLVMLIYGEFNVFRPADARSILARAWTALKPGGRLLLEPSTAASTRQIGEEPATWYSAERGLFSDRPHLVLNESFWDEPQRAAVKRYIVVDAETAQVTRYAASYQVYTDAELAELLAGCGFADITIHPSLTGDSTPGDFIAVTAVRC